MTLPLPVEPPVTPPVETIVPPVDGVVVPPVDPVPPVVFDPSVVAFKSALHEYDVSSLALPEGTASKFDVVLNRFAEMGLGQDHAMEILSMGMKPTTPELSTQDRLDKELSFDTKMNYQNIVNYAKNIGLPTEYLADPSKVTLIEEIMGKVNATASSGQPKVTELPTTDANVVSLTQAQVEQEYIKYVTGSDGFTPEERQAKIQGLIELATDKEEAKKYLSQFS